MTAGVFILPCSPSAAANMRVSNCRRRAGQGQKESIKPLSTAHVTIHRNNALLPYRPYYLCRAGNIDSRNTEQRGNDKPATICPLFVGSCSKCLMGNEVMHGGEWLFRQLVIHIPCKCNAHIQPRGNMVFCTRRSDAHNTRQLILP